MKITDPVLLSLFSTQFAIYTLRYIQDSDNFEYDNILCEDLPRERKDFNIRNTQFQSQSFIV